MSLVHQQALFLRHVRKLLAHAEDLGFTVTGSELYRTPEQQRRHVHEGRSRTMKSQHLKRLAIDLNFFVRNGGGGLTLSYDKDVLQPLGDFWENLDPANRWGGNWDSFKDTPHFERREQASSNGSPSIEAATGRTPPAANSDEPHDRRGIGLLNDAVGQGRPNHRTDVEAMQRLLNHAAETGALRLAAPLKADGIFGLETFTAINACQQAMLGVAEPDGVVDPDQATVRALCQTLEPAITDWTLSLIMLAASNEDVTRFVAPIRACCDKRDISTPLRQVHFLAQIGHESGELRYREELASGAAYEGRRDLGNTRAGDGERFKGRGLIQLTGRANYTDYGASIGREKEILKDPQILARDLELCVDVAGWFWSSRGLNPHADADDLLAITRAINGGTNGIAHRRALLSRGKAILGHA